MNLKHRFIDTVTDALHTACPTTTLTMQLGQLQRCCRHDDFQNTAPDLLDAGDVPCCDSWWSKQTRSTSALVTAEPSASTSAASVSTVSVSTSAASKTDSVQAASLASFVSTATAADDDECVASSVATTSTSASSVTADTSAVTADTARPSQTTMEHFSNTTLLSQVSKVKPCAARH